MPCIIPLGWKINQCMFSVYLWHTVNVGINVARISEHGQQLLTYWLTPVSYPGSWGFSCKGKPFAALCLILWAFCGLLASYSAWLAKRNLWDLSTVKQVTIMMCIQSLTSLTSINFWGSFFMAFSLTSTSKANYLILANTACGHWFSAIPDA